MEKLKSSLKDLLKAFLVGAGLSAGAALVFWLIGLTVSGFSPAAALDTAWRWLLLLGAGLLFLSAGCLMVSGKKDRTPAGWKTHFPAIGIAGVFGTVAVAVLLAASLLELLARHL